jgi:hypothetical protein
MLINPQLLIKMITRIFQIARASKYISLLNKTTVNRSISPIQLIMAQRFYFSEGKKNEDPKRAIS